jgi:hypothetical protein
MSPIYSMEDLEEDPVLEVVEQVACVEPEYLGDQQLQANSLIDEMSQTVSDYDTINHISDSLEKADDGVCVGGGNAVIAVVEHFSRKYALDTSKLSFEEYSTTHRKIQQTQLAVEGIREIAGKIFEKIKAFIRKIINFFKELFERKKERDAKFKEEMGTLKRRVDHVREVEKDPKAVVKQAAKDVSKPEHQDASVIPKPRAGYLTSTLVANALIHKGKFPKPEEMPHLVSEHLMLMIQSMREFFNGESETIKFTEEAMIQMAVSNEKYTQYLGKAFEGVFGLPVSMPVSADQTRFGPLTKGMVLHEHTLVFGGKSIFRTAMQDECSPKISDFHFTIASSTGATPYVDRAEIPALSTDLIENIIKYYDHDHKTFIDSNVKFHNESIKNLQHLEKEIIDLSENAKGNAGKRSMVRDIQDLLVFINRMVSTRDVGLIDYEYKIWSAVNVYCQASLSENLRTARQ